MSSPTPTEKTADFKIELLNLKKKRKMISNKVLIVIVLLIAVFTGLIYKPLPEEFPQKWKYRLICFGADLLTPVVRYLVFINF